ncbi:MAG TPA: BON domain-containing protein [Verrucomicrobiae bacterium]|nr:BON domain-containing protein [Verrucomicrobiae bacterium]
MRIFLALILGLALGAAAVWYFANGRNNTRVQSAANQAENAVKSAGDAIQEKLKVLDLRPQDIKDELARTGQVVRRKTKEAGQAIADATADARVTAAIKGKLVTNRDLSALSISVNTTAGVVTLSGTVNSTDDISKAMMLAMDTDGVKEVISTLQVKPRQG